MLSKAMTVGCVLGWTLAAATAPMANAIEVTVTSLHVPGARHSIGVSAGGTQQAGYLEASNGAPSAALWNGSANSWISLQPPGALHSSVFGADGTRQVGSMYDGTLGRAVLWSGTASSWVDLTPAAVVEGGYRGATALGISGNQQVGWAYLAPFPGSTQQRACVWSGTADSVVSLHQSIWADSIAYATNGTQQVGRVNNFSGGGGIRAALWSGTADSWVDLGPAGSIRSTAYSIAGNQQVGEAVFTDADGIGNGLKAMLWTGTAESAVVLHPDGASNSTARGTDGVHQVGAAIFPVAGGGNVKYASMWRGTASSWVNLNQYLPGYPAGWGDGSAESISTTGGTTRITGSVWNNSTSRWEAILWTITGSTCAADFNNSGTVTVQDIFDFLAAWFSNDPLADINTSGTVTVQDIFSFLAYWFAGC